MREGAGSTCSASTKIGFSVGAQRPSSVILSPLLVAVGPPTVILVACSAVGFYPSVRVVKTGLNDHALLYAAH